MNDAEFEAQLKEAYRNLRVSLGPSKTNMIINLTNLLFILWKTKSPEEANAMLARIVEKPLFG